MEPQVHIRNISRFTQVIGKATLRPGQEVMVEKAVASMPLIEKLASKGVLTVLNPRVLQAQAQAQAQAPKSPPRAEAAPPLEVPRGTEGAEGAEQPDRLAQWKSMHAASAKAWINRCDDIPELQDLLEHEVRPSVRAALEHRIELLQSRP